MYKTNGQLNAWWQRHLGSAILRAQIKEIETLLPGLSGQHLVLLGCSEQLRLLSSSKISHQVVLNATVTAFSTHKGLRGAWEALPFADNSIDVLVLPHTLELSGAGATALFNEVYRVLAPEGHLIIFSFNPSCIWRLWYACYPKDCRIPWEDHIKPQSVLRRSLIAMDYEFVKQKTFFYQVLECKHKKAICINAVFSGMKKIFSGLGGVTMTCVKKKVMSAKPLPLSWREKYLSQLKLGDRVANPTPCDRHRISK